MSESIIAESADGVEHEFPAETDRAVIDKVMKSYALSKSAKPVGSPSAMDYARTNPVVGAPLQTLLRGGQGIEQIAAHGVASAADLGGLAPNSVADTLHGVADRVDTAIADQNKGYEDAKTRVVNASTNPRVTAALTATGETMGNMVNPTGMAGNLIEAAPGVAGAALRGAASGAGFAASQPVADPSNYWTEKAKQVGIGGLTGAVTGAAVEAIRRNPPGNIPQAATFRQLATDSYNASRATGATVPRADFEAAITNAEANARNNVTYRPALHPRAATAIAQIREELDTAGNDVTFADMDVARRIARTVLTSPDRNERAVAHSIIDGIDDYVTSLNSQEGAALTTARDLFARGAKLDTIDRLMTRATDRIGANQTRTKFDNAVRQEFAAVVRNQRAIRQFTPEEQQAIRLIVRGRAGQNIARMVGRVAPTTSVPILGELGMIGHALANGNETEAIGIAGAASAGLVGQHVADRMGTENVNGLRILVSRGPVRLPLPRPAPNAPVRNSLAQFAAQAALQPGR